MDSDLKVKTLRQFFFSKAHIKKQATKANNLFFSKATIFCFQNLFGYISHNLVFHNGVAEYRQHRIVHFTGHSKHSAYKKHFYFDATIIPNKRHLIHVIFERCRANTAENISIRGVRPLVFEHVIILCAFF